MSFGLSLTIGFAIAAALFFGFLVGYAARSDRLPKLTNRRNLPHGKYICLGTIWIPGRRYNGRLIDTSYVTVLKYPNEELRIHRFREISSRGVDVCPRGVSDVNLA
ncbi:MAG: hypothetical protein JWN49_667 [Parcubacteria group bacterium]|nr:hypothetical protein [Parcubacteria group bacterium]